MMLRRAVLVMLATTGCATTRGTLEVEIPLPPNPAASELAFQAPVVVDARRFEESPRDPSIPSLKHAKEIGDTAITSRAIARKRNSYGMAMGDILLPEGSTVTDLAGDAIVRAFRNAGFAVLEPGAPGYGAAHPIQARIDQFWAWVTPGFWAMAVEFETKMNVVTDLGPFTDGEDVKGYIRLKSAAVSASRWRNTIDQGLGNFSVSLAESLRMARLAAPVSSPEPEATPGDGGDSEIESCFRSCKELTQRSDGECFDSCR